MADLIVDDKYIEDLCEFFNLTSEKAQLKVDNTLDILRKTTENAVIKGDTAQALQEYVTKLEEMRDCIRQYGKEAAALAKSFQEKIDEVDKKLY